MAFFSRKKKGSKAQADGYFTKGQWADALRIYEDIMGKATRDVKLLRRIADLRAKLGRNDSAVDAYRQAAAIYAESGFLVQAIALYKILLRLDPSAEDVGKKLSELYAERGISQEGRVPGFVAPPPQSAVADEPKRLDPDELPMIPLFSDLSADAFIKVLEHLVPHELDGGEYLFREGGPGDSIFIVSSGSVEVVTGEQVLAKLGEGLFFGEGAFFSREPRNADVRACVGDKVEVLEIRREDLEKLLGSYPGIGEALRRFYHTRIVDRLLGPSKLMAGLDAQSRAEMQGLFTALQVEEGSEVIHENDTGTDFYFIVSGRFLVETLSPNGDTVKLAELSMGDSFGEVALLGGAPRTATVRALTEGRLLEVEGAVFAQYLEKYPSIRQVLENTRTERAKDAVEKVLAAL
jgi:CRP-like cAMP-binding protein